MPGGAIRRRRAAFAMLAAAALATGATARAATPLESFLDGLDTWRCDFTQRVVDARGREVEAGAGQLSVQRPGHFRWDYQTAGGDGSEGQLLVADGRNLWFFDRDLDQVTVKPLGESLSATPMMLLSASLAELHAAFEQRDTGRRDGLAWVRVTPRAQDAEFARADVGFDGARLARMVVSDKLGQTVTLEFSHAGRNAVLAAGAFDFKPPAGADVIGKPVP